MSPEGNSPDLHRRSGRRRTAIGVAILLALIAGFAAWALLPRSLGTVTIERTALLSAGMADGGRKPATLATPVRIAVTFAVPEDMESVRARLGLGYVVARLADCRDDDDGTGAGTQEVVAQRAGYLGDYGRVTRLGSAPDGRTRYRAVFDDELTATVDHTARRTPARPTPGGLCLSLYGASMWIGHATSPAVPIGALPR